MGGAGEWQSPENGSRWRMVVAGEELLYPEAQSPLRELGFALRREAETRHLDRD